MGYSKLRLALVPKGWCIMKKIRSIRVSEQLWRRAQAKAKSEGKTVSEAINDFLKEFIK